MRRQDAVSLPFKKRDDSGSGAEFWRCATICEKVMTGDDDVSDDSAGGGHSAERVGFRTLDIQLEEIDVLEPELIA
jgi:hypothetical protein